MLHTCANAIQEALIQVTLSMFISLNTLTGALARALEEEDEWH